MLMIERIKSTLLFYRIVLLYFYEGQQQKRKKQVFFLSIPLVPLCAILIWVKFGSYLGQKVSPLETKMRKSKEKVLKTNGFQDSVVEISGIEPLTS